MRERGKEGEGGGGGEYHFVLGLCFYVQSIIDTLSLPFPDGLCPVP